MSRRPRKTANRASTGVSYSPQLRAELKQLDGPEHSTPLLEWMRLIDLSSNGANIHNVHEIYAALVGVRDEASTDGWSDSLRAQDSELETRLRRCLKGAKRARSPRLATAA